MTVEEFVVLYLSGRLAVPVSGDVPAPMPASFVTVEKVGGSETDKLPSARLAVQSWAPSRDAAARLCADVEAAMGGIVAEPEISRCALNSSYNFTDTSRKKPRYQAIFELVHYLT